jgi:uncharacterized iron-regulated membrane protein
MLVLAGGGGAVMGLMTRNKPTKYTSRLISCLLTALCCFASLILSAGWTLQLMVSLLQVHGPGGRIVWLGLHRVPPISLFFFLVLRTLTPVFRAGMYLLLKGYYKVRCARQQASNV